MDEVKLKIRGLYTLQNPFSEVPDGALEVADNIVIDRDSIASPRRGFTYLAGNFTDSGDRAHSLFEYQNKLVSHYDSNKLAYHDGAAWQIYSGTYNAVDYATDVGAKIRFLQANSNLYFLTSEGVKKIDAYNGAVSSAGIPKALGATGALSGVGVALLNDSQVGYRFVWGKTDANNNVVLGAPSQRLIVINPAATADDEDVDLVIPIPSGITTSHFLQVYRTFSSSAEDVDPGDEMFLVYEVFPDSGEITAKSLSYTDEVPDELVGASLYTNPSQESILQSNDQPPLAHDMCSFKGYTLYADTVGKHRAVITLLGIGGSNGLAATDTITIAGQTYTADATPVAATEFLISTGGSAAENIQATALALVGKINANTSNTTVYAFYLPGPDDLPGKILIEERDLGGVAFTVQASKVTAWTPDTTAALSSNNDEFRNAIYFSKYQQPEAVPLTNMFRVGSASDPILRIIPLRSSVIIFKETEGVYRLTGEDERSFVVDLFTSSTRLLAKNTPAVLSNTIYALTDQGVAQLTENNVQVVSRPIEDTLLELIGGAYSDIKDLSWAVGYESDRKYILNIVTDAADTYTRQAFVWNVFTNSWTRWTIEKSCGFVRPSDNFLYVGSATANRISKERKNFSFRDVADEELDITVLSVDETVLTLDSVDGIEEGDIYYESDSVYSVVESVDIAASTITLQYDVGATAGSREVLSSYECKVKWVPFTGGAPLNNKHFRDVSFIFDRTFAAATAGFTTDMSVDEDTTEMTGAQGAPYGLLPFGSGPFGGGTPRQVSRTLVPLEKRRASQLSVEFRQSISYSDFRLAGVQIVFNPLTQKVSDG